MLFAKGESIWDWRSKHKARATSPEATPEGVWPVFSVTAVSPSRDPQNLTSILMADPTIASLSAAVACLDPYNASTSLSDDVLSHIFHFLDVANLSNSALVCSHWHQVLWPSLRHLQFIDCNSVNVSVLETFAVRCQGLTALTLFRCLAVRDECASAMMKMPHLRVVNISYCDWITDGLVHGLKEHPSLTELRLVASCRVALSSSASPTPSSLSHAILPPKLTTLCLSAARGLDGDSLPAISRLNSLISLDLSFAAPALLANEQVQFLVALQSLTSINLFSASVVDAVLHVLAELPRLRLLDLSSNAKITAAGVSQLSKLAPTLEWLSLASCAAVNDLSLFTLARLPSLTYLDISYTGITDDSLETLSLLGKLKTFKATKQMPGHSFLTSLLRNASITALSLIDCTFDPTDLYLFKGFSALRTLNLLGSRGINDSFFPHLSPLSQLHSIYLASNYDITAKGVASLKSLPILSTLVLDWGSNISDAIGPSLSSFPSLTFLSLRSCHSLTDACLPSLVSLPKIITLDVTHASQIKTAKSLKASMIASSNAVRSIDFVC